MAIERPGKKASSATRTRLLCPECDAESFVNLDKLAGDEVLCSCGAKIDVKLIKYSLTSARPQQSAYPRMVGRYKLVKKLGQGGQAEVHLGIDPLDRKVAVKEYPGRGEDWEKALNEARCSMRCSCLNVVNTYDILEEDRTIVQEYVEGDNLRRSITARAGDARARGDTLFPLDQVVDLMVGILQGLLVCHVRGVIHLDLKPENVLIDSTSGIRIPKVFDFGLAHNLLQEGDRSDSGEVVLGKKGADQAFQGTPNYAPPEQIDPKRKHRIGARTDLYQAGILFYELLSGKTPFEGKDWKEIFHRILDWEPISLRDRGLKLPPELIEIQEKMCAREPEDRYPSVQEVLDALEAWRANRHVARYREASKGSRWWARILFFVLGIGLGAAVGFSNGIQQWMSAWHGEVSETQLLEAGTMVLDRIGAARREARIENGSRERALEQLDEAEKLLSVMRALVPDAPELRNLDDDLDAARRQVNIALPEGKTTEGNGEDE